MLFCREPGLINLLIFKLRVLYFINVLLLVCNLLTVVCYYIYAHGLHICSNQEKSWPGRILEISSIEENFWVPVLGMKGKADFVVKAETNEKIQVVNFIILYFITFCSVLEKIFICIMQLENLRRGCIFLCYLNIKHRLKELSLQMYERE